MNNKDLPHHLQQLIASEIELWTQEMNSFTTGYDYECGFSKRMQSIGKILLQASIDASTASGTKKRDKKKSKPHLVL